MPRYRAKPLPELLETTLSQDLGAEFQREVDAVEGSSPFMRFR